MRPLAVEMQAFGPFAGTQTIDFTVLGAKTFFLIHGPTGSGKTSVLDAMCFALFGDSSGGDRQAVQMRSHHADAGVLTQVRFDFELAGQRYRVLRIPRQMRPARRGTGEVEHVQAAEFFELDPVTGQERAIASGWSDVTQAVVLKLGFESRQFRQVIVLPQGRFFDFLKSNTQDRERVLQTLFGTGLYREIEERLSRLAADVDRQGQALQSQRAILLDQARAESLGALEGRVTELRKVAELRVAEEGAALAEATRSETALQLAQAVEARFVEFEAASADARALGQQGAARAAERCALQRARAAATAQPLVETAETASRHEQEASRLLAVARTTAAQAGREAVEAAAALVRQQEREAEREAANARLLGLQALQPRVRALEQAVAELKPAIKLAGQEDAALAKARKLCTDAAASEAEAAKRTREHEEAARQVPGLQARWALLTQQAGKAEELERVRQQVPELQRDAEARRGVAQSHAEALVRVCAHRDTVRAQWLASQAARLAQAIHEGDLCPVCGSSEHPVLAHAGAHVEVVRDDALDLAESLIRQAETACRTAEGESAQAQRRLEQAVSRLGELATDLSGVQDTPAQLRARAAEATAELAKARLMAEDLATAHAASGKAVTALDRARAALIEVEKRAEAARANRDRLQAVVEERSIDVAPEFLGPAALQAAISTALASRDMLIRALNDATEQASKARTAEASAQTLLAAREQEQRVRALQHDEACRLRDERLRTLGFDLVSAYEASRMTDEQMTALETVLHQYDLAVSAASARLERARIGELERPDLRAIRAVHEGVKAVHHKAITATRDAVNEAMQAENLLTLLRKATGELEEIQARYGLVKKVSDLANGVGAQRMSFQRYVLATLLEEVLVATSLRLRVMSRGRYELRRVTGTGDRRAAAGLDLEVFDHHTGTQRATNTLSGGEQFLTSLALALGLSDVVQAYAGGIRMDSIFIDEGFGTLDTEALDLAIRALKDLQQAGRLVGIISHVTELREWIDARLEIRPGTRGSTASFST